MADKKFLEHEQLTDEQLDKVAGGTGGCEPEDPEIMFEDMCEPADPEIGFSPTQPTQAQEAELFDFGFPK